jgi:Flp pilus assembly protein TadD
MNRILPTILLVSNIFIQQIIAQTKRDSVALLRQQGIQLYVQGDYRGAALVLKTCLSDSTNDTLANYYSGLCAYQLGNYPLAESNFSMTFRMTAFRNPPFSARPGECKFGVVSCSYKRL